ncbi:MAG: HupE/UreJ family protein [Methyloligellaceae bacterium]
MRIISRRCISRLLLCAAILALTPALGIAHESPRGLDGVASGFLHPVQGFDHLLAMLAVGIWGAQMGWRAIWTLPVVFPLIMAIGGVLGVTGVTLPQTELAIALSELVLGLAILCAWRAPVAAAAAIAGGFAIFHGHAHGLELPEAANPAAYGFGFIAATGLIHVAGIGFGLIAMKSVQGWVARCSGGVIALAGLYFLAV